MILPEGILVTLNAWAPKSHEKYGPPLLSPPEKPTLRSPVARRVTDVPQRCPVRLLPLRASVGAGGRAAGEAGVEDRAGPGERRDSSPCRRGLSAPAGVSTAGFGSRARGGGPTGPSAPTSSMSSSRPRARRPRVAPVPFLAEKRSQKMWGEPEGERRANAVGLPGLQRLSRCHQNGHRLQAPE